MKVFIRLWARPLGVEPVIFNSIDEATIRCDCEISESACSPWCAPDILEFESEFLGSNNRILGFSNPR